MNELSHDIDDDDDDDAYCVTRILVIYTDHLVLLVLGGCDGLDV
jgi:hypothetical protein